MSKARGGSTPKFGRLLVEYRERLGKRKALTEVVRRLADEYGISMSASTIHRYENGRPPDAGLLWGLCQVYQADFLTLCGVLAKELGGTLDETPKVPPKPLSGEEEMLLGFYRKAADHPKTQAAMLVACEALAGATAVDTDAADYTILREP